MKAKIVAFVGSRTTTDLKRVVLKGEEIKTSVGKKVYWKTRTGNTISGRIISHHGEGVVARFSRGLPGDALGTPVMLSISEAKAEPVKEVKKRTPKKKATEKTPLKKEVKKEEPKKKTVKKAAKKAPVKKAPGRKTPAKKAKKSPAKK